ncbi:hypothetical protein TIFTF001_044702 [Ficus carica]|uniref:Uncharacterized protein n=1 Tax=Ficus carica TaxID=3494 RepID=A0AA87ZH23_FICCA|nr:hypothetical protein TIFTF001_044702 [Ficus carica]
MKERKFPSVLEALGEGKSAMGVKRLKPKGEGRGGTDRGERTEMVKMKRLCEGLKAKRSELEKK